MAKERNGIFPDPSKGKPEENLPPGDDAPQPESPLEPDALLAEEEENPLLKKIEDLEKEVAQVKDQLLRKAAEFENYRKRVESEALMRLQFANERLLGSLLPVVDDFERSLKMGKGQKDAEVVYNGIGLIYQKLMKILESQGMKPYDSLGKPFNTDFHDALMQLPKKDVAPHTVIDEVEKGYMLNDRVLRHAKVIVASGDAPDEGQSGDGAADNSTTMGHA